MSPLCLDTRYKHFHIGYWILFSFVNVWNNIGGWKASASPPVKELPSPTGPRINFLMLPFQNKHGAVRVRAETERDGGWGGGGWKSPPGGTGQSQHGAPSAHKAHLV